jgi:hypothetical protein
MIRIARSVAVSTFAATLAFAAMPSPAASPPRETCAWFANAAFNDRHTRSGESFRMALARSCAEAEAIAEDFTAGTPRGKRARDHLTRLEAYRHILNAMFLDRFLSTREAVVRPLGDRIGRPVAYPVSETGAYLIAHRTGLVGAQRDWRAWISEARID